LSESPRVVSLSDAGNAAFLFQFLFNKAWKEPKQSIFSFNTLLYYTNILLPAAQWKRLKKKAFRDKRVFNQTPPKNIKQRLCNLKTRRNRWWMGKK